jgi:phosphotransferase system  glucose/maltose/N-acetylglucosamine-specific IIC component
MLFQDAPPDTSAYMIAGYAVFFAISIIYVFSLAIRRRNLERDLETLETMGKEAASKAAPNRS